MAIFSFTPTQQPLRPATPLARLSELPRTTDRRAATRRRSRTFVTAVCEQQREPGLPPRTRILTLQMRDISARDLGALSTEPIEPGSQISFYFPPQNLLQGCDIAGRVVRCDKLAQGYEIGVEFDPRSAA